MITLKPEEVRITSDGMVVISNKQLAKSILEKAKRVGPDMALAGIFDNCDCNRGCGESIKESILVNEVRPETKFSVS